MTGAYVPAPPTTEELRDAYEKYESEFGGWEDYMTAKERFDVWLTEHDRQTREQAWDEGHEMGGRSPIFQTPNPYRKDA